MSIRFTALVCVCLVSSVCEAEVKYPQAPATINPYDTRSDEVANRLKKTMNYHKCILKHMKSVGSDFAAMRISEACMALEDEGT